MNIDKNYFNRKNDDKSLPDFAFLCTMCWQYQSHGTKPRILGESARIVCEKCWRGVIDLSICWVCGDTVVRGDEVVSLGWCFWHYSCFGCLVCGMQISVPKNEKSSKISSDEFNRDLNDSGRRGVELENVPLCHFCQIEMEGEEKDQLVERALVTVSMFDGGLSRQRFEYLEVGKDQSLTIASPKRRKLKFRSTTSNSSTDIKIQLSSESADEISPLLDNAAHMSISNIGDSISVDEVDSQESSFCTSDSDAEPIGSAIYLSIFDPLGDVAFTPSTTKPLPRWMNRYPKNLGVIKERKTNLVSAKINPNSEEAEVVYASMTTDLNSDLEDIS
ncbi:hypothetical protein OnM2_027028 [Erysiphe neolycopersici]|uniref:LIM zinc-binding domain-containing protein n=1 Tax=Erysiphe neolycopersici TaxID=212602 RepID=A0A420I0B0_9PEZI|nr:hypothetical protein OnM2_027028 [Erysiphe neolycopersici]